MLPLLTSPPHDSPKPYRITRISMRGNPTYTPKSSTATIPPKNNNNTCLVLFFSLSLPSERRHLLPTHLYKHLWGEVGPSLTLLLHPSCTGRLSGAKKFFSWKRTLREIEVNFYKLGKTISSKIFITD